MVWGQLGGKKGSDAFTFPATPGVWMSIESILKLEEGSYWLDLVQMN